MENLSNEIANKIGCHPDDFDFVIKLIKYYPICSELSIEQVSSGSAQNRSRDYLKKSKKLKNIKLIKTNAKTP